MDLLVEYAITPDVFDVTSYTGPEACGLYLDKLRVPLEYEVLVRNLRRGEWLAYLLDSRTAWHRSTKDLLKKLGSEGRLIEREAARAAGPTDPFGWCEEAILSHELSELTGVVTTPASAGRFRHNNIVASIDALASASWWQARRSSARLQRTIQAYKDGLRLFLLHANSLMFIDPHLDLRRTGYFAFPQLIDAIGSRRPAPRIEIHRVCYSGSGRQREILSPTAIEEMFREGLARTLSNHNLSAEIFIWDDFHYRCLITNLGGLLLENGIDTSAAPGASTIWAWLDRRQSDDVQREFEPRSGRHTLRQRFTLP